MAIKAPMNIAFLLRAALAVFIVAILLFLALTPPIPATVGKAIFVTPLHQPADDLNPAKTTTGEFL